MGEKRTHVDERQLLDLIIKYGEEGVTNKQLAQDLGVTPGGVNGAMRRGVASGWREWNEVLGEEGAGPSGAILWYYLGGQTVQPVKARHIPLPELAPAEVPRIVPLPTPVIWDDVDAALARERADRARRPARDVVPPDSAFRGRQCRCVGAVRGVPVFELDGQLYVGTRLDLAANG